MPYLLDSNAWIAWLRQRDASLLARLQREAPSNLLLCSVVVGELIYGAERSGAAYRAHNLHEVEQLRARFASLPFDDSCAEVYGRIRADLSARGLMIGPNDALIAAIALANDVTLVSHNTAEFGRIAGLSLEDWQTP